MRRFHRRGIQSVALDRFFVGTDIQADMRHETFRRLLAQEAGNGADAPAMAVAARRLCERFAQQLIPVIGPAGVAAICSRSLRLVQRQFPSIGSIPTPDEGPFAGVQTSLQKLDPSMAADAAVALLTTASQLLDSFIGEGLTTRLLHGAWPDDFNDDAWERTA
jgi:hypothetical protein